MEAELPDLNCSEFQMSSLFAQVWPKAVAEWQKRVGHGYHLSSSAQAIAIMAYTMDVSIMGQHLYKQFNNKVRVAGQSSQVYRDNFHYKTLHFLLTDALATLRSAQKGQKCHWVYWGVDEYKFKANVGDIIRFGQFASSTLHENVIKRFGTTTVFKVKTCHSAYIRNFSKFHSQEEVLIPPFEKFKVIKAIPKGKNVEIHLNSTGTYSKYNCEWLKDTVSQLSVPVVLGQDRSPVPEKGRNNGGGPGGRGIEEGFRLLTVWIVALSWVSRGGRLDWWEHPQGPWPPRKTPPGHHTLGSGHRDPLSHEATKVTMITLVTVATMATMAT
ncbi:erythroblast NAD(P)(+)--arginine ADP-ribosyltransferase-like protein [Turdus rufiventris]|nr:erythroblast NAD(P)(+)--arginine ADP-ribosyltransferase-like protein [Turdus rufiventris]